MNAQQMNRIVVKHSHRLNFGGNRKIKSSDCPSIWLIFEPAVIPTPSTLRTLRRLWRSPQLFFLENNNNKYKRRKQWRMTRTIIAFVHVKRNRPPACDLHDLSMLASEKIYVEIERTYSSRNDEQENIVVNKSIGLIFRRRTERKHISFNVLTDCINTIEWK
jgi:hypothetical protein